MYFNEELINYIFYKYLILYIFSIDSASVVRDRFLSVATVAGWQLPATRDVSLASIVVKAQTGSNEGSDVKSDVQQDGQNERWTNRSGCCDYRLQKGHDRLLSTTHGSVRWIAEQLRVDHNSPVCCYGRLYSGRRLGTRGLRLSPLAVHDHGTVIDNGSKGNEK